MVEVNVLNSDIKKNPEVPVEQERINVSNIPPKSIGQRELDDTVLTETSTNTVTNKTIASPILSGTITGTGITDSSTSTMTNKTLTSPVINTSISGTAIATGAEVTTGTDDTQIVTPKAIGDAGVNTRLKSIIIAATRDMTAASGNVAYTGVGFQPTSVIAIASINATLVASWGFVDSALTDYGRSLLSLGTNGNHYVNQNLIYLALDTSNNQQAYVASYDADGFTLTWTKTGSPTGTGTLSFICYK